MIFIEFFKSFACGFMACTVVADFFILGVDWTTVIVGGLCAIVLVSSINAIRW